MPVTAHPWFPAIVALWFAALLGLSSLVLAPAMLERIVATSRIDMVLAAAAPPLGQTARLLLALGLAGLGGIFGLVLGRILAARSRRSAVARPTAETTERELDDSDQDLPAPGLRDRLARLTGQGDGPRDFEDLPRLRARDRHPDAPGRKPLSAEDAIVANVMATEGLDKPGPLPDAQVDDAMVEAEPLALEAAPEAAPEAAIVEEPAPLAGFDAPAPPATPSPAPTAAAAIVSAPLDSLGVVQLTERLAISMRDRRERNARRAEAIRAASGASGEPPIVLPSLIARQPAHPVPSPAAPPVIASEALETGYSSLLGLTRKPVARDPVRPALHSAEPAVRSRPFAAAPAAALRFADNESNAGPGKIAEAGDPAENYRALKAALASLQQISGTR